ncbi:hypothetical protein MAM1_0064d03907 [Mucor ambiguus]|uniref:Uncharacterized protein n=1 Tax=Mucor ambiguus TaxID=91626 RepID=A0A0C9MMP9_9FUNG|nr:hypothetical protein MAM1_0064d03907 [Mucor ambiguus]
MFELAITKRYGPLLSLLESIERKIPLRVKRALAYPLMAVGYTFTMVSKSKSVCDVLAKSVIAQSKASFKFPETT